MDTPRFRDARDMYNRSRDIAWKASCVVSPNGLRLVDNDKGGDEGEKEEAR